MRYLKLVFLFLLTLHAGLPARAQDGGQKWKQTHAAAIKALEDGDYVLSEQKMRQALDLARPFGESDGRYAETVGDLGAVLYLQRRYDEARSFLEAGLRLHIAPFGAHEKTGNAGHWLGEFYFEVGEYEKAVDMFRYTIDIRRQAAVPEDNSTILVHKNLGVSLVRLGKPKEALEPLSHTVKFQSSSPDTEKGELAGSYGWSGVAYYRAGRYRESAAQHQLAVNNWKSAGDQSNVAQALHRLGEAYEQLGSKRDTEQAYLEELATWDGLLGENSKESLGALRKLQAIYQEQGQSKLAAAFDERVSIVTGEPAPAQIPAARQNTPSSAAASGNAVPDPYDVIPAILYRKATVGVGCDRSDKPANMSDDEYQAAMFIAWSEIALEKEATDLQEAYGLYAEALYTGLECTRSVKDTIPNVMIRIAVLAMHLDRKNEAEKTASIALQFADIQFKNNPRERRGIYKLFAELHRKLGNQTLADEAEAFAAQLGK